MTLHGTMTPAGVDVHLEPHECDLLMRLASDVELVRRYSRESGVRQEAPESYFTLAVSLGERLRALTSGQTASGAPGMSSAS